MTLASSWAGDSGPEGQAGTGEACANYFPPRKPGPGGPPLRPPRARKAAPGSPPTSTRDRGAPELGDHSRFGSDAERLPEPGLLSAWRLDFLHGARDAASTLPAPVSTNEAVTLLRRPAPCGKAGGGLRVQMGGAWVQCPSGPPCTDELRFRLTVAFTHNPGMLLTWRPGLGPMVSSVSDALGLVTARGWEGRGRTPGLVSIPDCGPPCPLPTPWAHTCSAKSISIGWNPTAPGPHGLERDAGARLGLRAHEDGARLWRLWLEVPVAPGPGPQGALRVTRCDEKGDTDAGPGPGQAAIVSLLGFQPLRQVQETDRHGQAKQAAAGP